MANQARKSVVHRSEQTYGGSFHADLVEQYKLYVQSAENVSARRVASSRYLLTVNAALVALYGLQSASFSQHYWALLIPCMGIPVCVLWYLIIKSHADLNRIKFDVIHELEQHLPAAMYKHEWDLAGGGPRQDLPGSNNHRTMGAFAVRCTARGFGDHNRARNRWRHGLGEMTTISESTVEQAALDWLRGLRWRVAHGPDIAPDPPGRADADVGQRTI